MTTLRVACACRATHSPAPLGLEVHHIWPTGLGGPDVAANKVAVCPTTHTNVHELLREIQKRSGQLTFSDATALFDEPVSRYAFALAQEGYRRVTTGSIT